MSFTIKMFKERAKDFLLEIYVITRLGLLVFFTLGLLSFWLGYYVGNMEF